MFDFKKKCLTLSRKLVFRTKCLTLHMNVWLPQQSGRIQFTITYTSPPLHFFNKKATATMKLEAYHQSFVKTINALIHVDKSLALWSFKEANALESDLLKTPFTLGSSNNQILKYVTAVGLAKHSCWCMWTVWLVLTWTKMHLCKVSWPCWLTSLPKSTNACCKSHISWVWVGSLAPMNILHSKTLSNSFKMWWPNLFPTKPLQSYMDWTSDLSGMVHPKQSATKTSHTINRLFMSMQWQKLPWHWKHYWKKPWPWLGSIPTPIFLYSWFLFSLKRHWTVKLTTLSKQSPDTVIQSMSKSFSSKILLLNWPLPALA